jgi:hypothetical protein
VQRVTKYQNAEFKWDRYFVNKVETQLREKPLRGSQTQEIHYSKDKTSNKSVTLTYPYATIVSCTLTRNPTWTPSNQVTYLKGSSMDSINLGLLLKIDFNISTTTAQWQWFKSKLINKITHKLYSLVSKEFNIKILQIACLTASIDRQ